MHLLASSASSTYTIQEPIEVTEIVKKSRFIGKVSPFKTIEDASSIVKQLSEQKATHNCWAFRSSSIPSYERSSDDGEPGGTAGRPILAALESAGIVDAVVVVTRYYGGIKLGTGGLSRAYGSAARVAIQASHRILVIPSTILKISMSINDVGVVYQTVSNSNANPTATTGDGIVRLSEEYSDDATMVFLYLKLPLELVESFQSKIIDLCRGTAVIEEVTQVEEIDGGSYQ